MSYPLLEQAPQDHSSEEFLQFLRDHNEVIKENRIWLVIANCKYDAPQRRWFTAFYKPQGVPQRVHFGRLFIDTPFGWSMMMKEPEKRTVKRPHVHIFQT